MQQHPAYSEYWSKYVIWRWTESLRISTFVSADTLFIVNSLPCSCQNVPWILRFSNDCFSRISGSSTPGDTYNPPPSTHVIGSSRNDEGNPTPPSMSSSSRRDHRWDHIENLDRVSSIYIVTNSNILSIIFVLWDILLCVPTCFFFNDICWSSCWKCRLR